MTMPKGIVFKPSLLDRRRASWARQFAARPDEIKALQKAYREKYKKRLKRDKAARQAASSTSASRLLFTGMLMVQKIVCEMCPTVFLVEKSRANYRPRFCPLCASTRQHAQRRAYDARTGRSTHKKAKA